MKNILTILIAIIVIQIQAQTNYIDVCSSCYHNINFDFNSTDDSSNYYIEFDTAQSNNIWQIGQINKSEFNTGYNGPRALVTDTASSYPVNNVSTFQFSVIQCSHYTAAQCGYYEGMDIGLSFKIDSDIDIDGGTIEVSHSNGPWINIIEDTLLWFSANDLYTINDTIKSLNKPGFSGTSSDWIYINLFYPSTSSTVNDTINFRFTFASDSIQDNKDGWMIGEVYFGGAFEGIEEINNNNLISIFPNPVSDMLNIQYNGFNLSNAIQIYDITGKTVFKADNLKENSIDIQNLQNGIYFLKYSNGNEYSFKKFIVQQ